MRMSLAELGRRVARCGIGVLLAPLGLLTIVLFFATGQAVPSSFVPAEQLKFRMRGLDFGPDEKGRPDFLGLSPRGRCILTINWNSGTEIPDIVVIDPASMQDITSFHPGWDKLLYFELSPDRRSLVHSQGANCLYVHDLVTGKEDKIEIEPGLVSFGEASLCPGADVAFDPSGRSLLIATMDRVFQYDLSECRTTAVFRPPANCIVLGCFFSSGGRPRIIVHKNEPERLETWDVKSNQLGMVLDISAAELRALGLGKACLSPVSAAHIPVLAIWNEESGLLTTRSFDDGRLLQSFSFPCKPFCPIRFSADGRFLISIYLWQHPLLALTDGCPQGLKDWLETRFPSQERLALLDLQTSRTWQNLVSGEGCAFSDDGTRLISFTNDGRYEYDVPPRWQNFTPWAWAALSAWLSLAAIWWKLRKRRLGLAAVA